MSWGMVGAAAIGVAGNAMMSKGGGGGGGGGGGQMPAPAPAAPPPPPVELQTTGYGGMGHTQIPQTFTAQGKPEWMTGHFAAPWWGKDAATGAALNQAALQPQTPPAPAAATAPVEDPRTRWRPNQGRRLSHLDQFRFNNMGTPDMGTDIGYGTRGGHWSGQPWNRR